LFNHYRDIPTVGTQTAKQLPNFVGGDFFELPANYSKAGDVVAEINKRFANG
jgi:hypothetical protein